MPSVQFSFRICQNYPAPVGFLPEPDFCRIWKSAGFRPEPKSGTALLYDGLCISISARDGNPFNCYSS